MFSDVRDFVALKAAFAAWLGPSAQSHSAQSLMGFDLVGNALPKWDMTAWWKSVLFPDYIYHGRDGSKGFIENTEAPDSSTCNPEGDSECEHA
eukprot:Tamp_36647.p2 GENE.Tamp_36647~~Tamp_36647.p2  ORF type:complete len:108 (-),score=20.86 Tamp_36647:224-502(-)